MYKKSLWLIVMILLLVLVTGCSTGETEATEDSEQEVAVIVSLTQTAAAVEAETAPEATEIPKDAPPQSSEMGIISGTAYGIAPPTPPLSVYAMDLATGQWYAILTQQSETIATFEFEVNPGEYILFAQPMGLAYSEDGLNLSTVKIAAGETVSDIEIRPPSQDECGATFGVPPSPDGQYPELKAGEYCADDAYYTPLPAMDCAALNDSMIDALKVNGEVTFEPFTNYMIEEIGQGCTMRYEGTGLNFASNMTIEETVTNVLAGYGYLEDPTVFMVGGAAAVSTGYRQGNRECQFTAYWEPRDINLCPDDQPITSCQLEPADKVYKIILSFAEAPMDSVAMPGTGPMRIEFNAGEISAQIPDTIAPGGLIPYVVYAMEGQQMSVVAQTSGYLILDIWGQDGTVLISSSEGTNSWSGTLPATQDYYIDVISEDQSMQDYWLDIAIPPISATEDDAAFLNPTEIQILTGTNVSVMLPAYLPDSQVVPFITFAESGEYQVSLDYGEECQGAGACHYGILGGKLVVGTTPEDMTNLPYEGDRAIMVSLIHDIPGWFVDFACGANCSDALVYWIVNGNQYVAGIKAGSMEQVISLANSVIGNSIQ